MDDAEDPVICLCRGVRESEIVAAAVSGCRDLAGIREETSATTGCGDCAVDIEDILAEQPGAALLWAEGLIR